MCILGLGGSPGAVSGGGTTRSLAKVAPLADLRRGAEAFATVLERGTSDAERADAMRASPSLSICFSAGGAGLCGSTAIDTARRFFGEPWNE